MERQEHRLEPGQTLNLQSSVYTEFEIITKGGTKVTGSVTANNPMSLLAGNDIASIVITIPKEGSDGLRVLRSD